MKQIITFCLLLSISGVVFAQNTALKVSGKVTDNGSPIEAATATLHSVDKTPLGSVTTAKDGSFALSVPKAGRYIVSISAVGYKAAWSEILDIRTTMSLPGFAMQHEVKKLDEVVVTGKKPLFEQKIDRMVVNVDASPGNVGLTALEVLERTPGVTVDKDGNISLKGKSGVMIMLDGKPTYLSNEEVTNLLRSLPSTQLDQLEIMTNPPAKFDAAGNAGVINIKTKKNKARGFNGNVTAGAGMGNMFRSNNSLNLNYRHNKVNLFSNYSFNHNENMQQLEIFRRFSDANTGETVSFFDQKTKMENIRNTQTLKLGMDIFATKKTTYGVVLTGLYNPGENTGDNVTFIKDPSGEVETQMNATSAVNSLWKNAGINFNFRHQFDSTGREISADADYLTYKNSADQVLSSYFFDKSGQPSAPEEIMKSSLPSTIRIASMKVDYVHPLKKHNAKLEAGAKSSYVTTDNDAVYHNLESGDWVLDTDRSNRFKYTENINALYVNASKQFNKKWSGQVGLRLENTIGEGEQVTTGEKFDRNYTQLFPTGYASYKANDKNQFTVSYGRRIQRPSYQDMNPFYFFLDKYTFQVGNPYLKPQFSHNVDLSHTFKGFLTTTLNYTNTNDIIMQVLEQDDATTTTYVQMGNIAKQQQIGLAISAGFPVTKWWTANVFLNGFYNEFEGPINGNHVELSAPGFMGNMQNMLKFNKGWGAEVSAFYRSRTQEGVFTSQSMGQISFAGSKNVMKGKGTIRLNVRDPFDLQMFRGSSRYGNVDVRIRNQWDNRTVYASFTYRFGKPIQGPQARRKNSGASDEQNRVKMEN
ncbi:MAG TPA: TonB-dependent receptor [Phnomibacter sp.]|nr:TonB-dependent receptor [Phnomibacter sp.]